MIKKEGSRLGWDDNMTQTEEFDELNSVYEIK